jgi:molybdopterin synthase sulfur carrier subunit
MPTVWIPSLLRDLTGGRESVEIPGDTVGEILTALETTYPGVRARLCEGYRLAPTVTAHVDGKSARRGLDQPLKEESEIQFLPTIAGG